MEEYEKIKRERKREMEMKARHIEMQYEKMLNDLQAFVERHLSKNHLYLYAHEHNLELYDDGDDDDDDDDDENQSSSGGTNSSSTNNNSKVVKCVGCSFPINCTTRYRCNQCQYCFFHKQCAELPQQITHPCHESHPLRLIPADDLTNLKSDQRCLGCYLPLLMRQGTSTRTSTPSSYGCIVCGFYLHKACLELPTKLSHRFHPQHVLFLQSDGYSCVVSCDCLPGHFGYSCKRCEFCMCISCLISNATEEDGKMGHVLTLHTSVRFRLDLDSASNYDCLACGEELDWQGHFHCWGCNFYLHVRCALQPNLNSVHHRHLLKLVDFPPEDELDSSSSDDDDHDHDGGGNSTSTVINLDQYYCDSCEKKRLPMFPAYRCQESKCSFVAHCHCEFLEENVSIAHKLDSIELITSTIMIKTPAETIVSSLRENCSGETIDLQELDLPNNNSWVIYSTEIGEEEEEDYSSTDPGEINLISNTAEKSLDLYKGYGRQMSFWDYQVVIKKIKSFFDARRLPTSSTCHGSKTEDNGEQVCFENGCELTRFESLLYTCTECYKILQEDHLPTSISKKICCTNDEYNYDLIPLQELPVDVSLKMLHYKDDDRCCTLCTLPLWDTLTYCCKYHGYNFHKSCLQIPLKISDHPLHHPFHSMELWYSATKNCNACGEDNSEHAFRCFECYFHLHVKCIFREFTVISHNNEHLLTFIEDDHSDHFKSRTCSHCKKQIRQPPFLYCGICDFSFHQQCQLPSTITISCHRHPLTFADSHWEEDLGKYNCDACEERRKPDEPVYHCLECDAEGTFVAHIGCAISKRFERSN